MVVVESSAVIAFLDSEVDAATFADAIEATERVVMSAVNVRETANVLHRRRGMTKSRPAMLMLVVR